MEQPQQSSSHDNVNPQQPPQHAPVHQLLKIHSDNQSKRQQLIHWGLFFFVTFLTFVLIAALPHPTTTITEGDSPCTNPVIVDSNGSISCKPYDIYKTNVKGLIVSGLTQFNQFALFSTNIYFKDTTLDLNYKGTVKITLYNLVDVDGVWNATKRYEQQIAFNLISGSSTNFFDDQGNFIGFTVELDYLREVNSENFLFIANFSLSAETLTNIQNIEIYETSISKSFSVFSIAIRFIFFGGSIVSLTIYINNIRRFQWKQLVIEQRLVLVLSAFCVFFNDPFYPITILNPNNASNFFSVLFIVNMAIALLFFWVCVLERVDVENGEKESGVITIKKIIYAASLWLVVLGYYLYFSYKHNSDPFVNVEEVSSGFMLFLLIASIVLLVILLIKLLFSFINIYRYYETKMWRNKLFANFSVFFVLCIFLFFFSNGFEIYSTFPNRVFLIFVEVNMYVFYLCFMYSPTKQAFEQMKDYEELNEFEGMMSNVDEEIGSVKIHFEGEVIDIDGEYQEENGKRQGEGNPGNKSFENWNGYNNKGKSKEEQFEKQYDSEDEGDNIDHVTEPEPHLPKQPSPLSDQIPSEHKNPSPFQNSKQDQISDAKSQHLQQFEIQ